MKQLELDFGPEQLYNHIFDVVFSLESPVENIYKIPMSEILQAARQWLNDFETQYYVRGHNPDAQYHVRGYDDNTIGRCDTYEIETPYPWPVSGDSHD